jgi:hypothetical protein
LGANESAVAGLSDEFHLLLERVDPTDPTEAGCTLYPYMSIPGVFEAKFLHFSIDMLNIANTRRNLLVNQDVDVDFGLANVDFKKPGYFDAATGSSGQNLVIGFVQPFSARFHVAFKF